MANTEVVDIRWSAIRRQRGEILGTFHTAEALAEFLKPKRSQLQDVEILRYAGSELEKKTPAYIWWNGPENPYTP